MSTIATSSIEEVAQGTGNSPKFFQLYIYRDRKITLQLLKRVEKAGFRAILLTIDTPFFGQRYADQRNRFHLPAHLKMANFEHLNQESNRVNYVADKDKPSSGLNEYASSLFDASITWKDVDWLKSVTKLPIVVKGVLTREDALLALEHKCDGILVSNHGGRQLDTVLASVS